jgi:hypothetical protein
MWQAGYCCCCIHSSLSNCECSQPAGTTQGWSAFNMYRAHDLASC